MPMPEGCCATIGCMARPRVSFEFFPPKTPEMTTQLWQAIERLAPLGPDFVSVTYGAGGTTRERTHETVKRIRDKTTLTPAAHLTCVGESAQGIDAIALDYWQAGIQHIVALRGDMPEIGIPYQPHPGGYAYASDLVKGLLAVAPFEISVAAYPEGHPDAPSLDFDLDNLARKLDAGAKRAITQYFFDVDVYLKFQDRARARGITAPIVPGILPVTNFKQLVNFSARCGASVPGWLGARFEGLDADPQTRQMVAAHVAMAQCQRLMAEGVEQFHFYTLNRADLTYAICHLLGVRAEAAVETLAGGAA